MNFLKFINRQIGYLKKRDYSAVLMFLWFPVSIPAVLLMRLIRPFLLVRLFNCQSHSMGGFVRELDVYVRSKKLGLNIPKQRTCDFFYVGPMVTNQQLLQMWKRVLPRIWDGWFYWFFYSAEWVNNQIPGGEIHNFPSIIASPSPLLLKEVPPYLHFTDQEEARGKAGLREMGIPPEALYVGLLVRDHAYMASVHPKIDDNINNFRNCDVDNFILVSEELAYRGYYVVRMGAKVAKKFNVKNEKIIDYAPSRFRNDFMDMYLARNCSFFMTTVSGFDRVPNYLFNKPVICFNYIGIDSVYDEWRRAVVFIAKKYFDPFRQCYLSLKEICNRNLLSIHGNFKYFGSHHDGLCCVENSPEEIFDATIEAVERLQGTWKPHPEDEELQNCFWSFFPAYMRETSARFSAVFLRKNQEWFLK